MIVTNKYIGAILSWIFRNKTRKLSYGYERELLDDDVLDEPYIRQFIAELREDVEDYIKGLEQDL